MPTYPFQAQELFYISSCERNLDKQAKKVTFEQCAFLFYTFVGCVWIVTQIIYVCHVFGQT